MQVSGSGIKESVNQKQIATEIMKLSDYFRKKEKKFGLALGGGAALGAAHIGVLKADTRQTKKLIEEGYQASIQSLSSKM